MGEVTSPILPTAHALPFQSKLSPAEHVEDTAILRTPAPIDRAGQRQPSSGSLKRPTISTTTSHTIAKDSVMEPDTPTSSKADSKSNSDFDNAPQARDWAPSTTEEDPSFRPPTPLREYPHSPKLWIDYEPPTSGGEAYAKWVQGFVSVIYEHYKDWPVEKRTAEFEKLFNYDPDRFRNVIVRFYADYPDLIPDRPLEEVAEKFVASRWNSTPAREAKMKLVFNDWSWNPDAPVVSREDPPGPKGEVEPGECVECKHCIRKANRSFRSLSRAVVRPITSVRRKFSVNTTNSTQDPSTTKPETKPKEAKEELSAEHREQKETSSCDSSRSSSAKSLEDAKQRNSGAAGAGAGIGGIGRRWAIRPRTSTQVERPIAATAVQA